MEGTYDTSQICINGHVITNSAVDFPNHRTDFCGACGAKTIMECPHCQKSIKGNLRGVVILRKIPAPKFCINCGKSFPWTELALNAAIELAKELPLEKEEKESLISSLPDLVSDSPKTQPAMLRVRRVLTKGGVESAKMMKEILVDVVSESVKKAIWGPGS